MPRWNPSIRASYGVSPSAGRERLRHLADETHHLLQVPPNGGEVGGRAGFAPDFFTGRIGSRLGLDEIGRQRGRPRVSVAHEPKIGRPPRIGRLAFGFRRVQILADAPIDQQSVRHAGEHRKLVAPRRTAAGRHHRRRIPAEHRGGFAHRGDAGETGGKAVVGGRHVASAPRSQMPNMTTRTTARENHVTA